MNYRLMTRATLIKHCEAYARTIHKLANECQAYRNMYARLIKHLGHAVAIVYYGKSPREIVLECIACVELILTARRK